LLPDDEFDPPCPEEVKGKPKEEGKQ